MKLAPIITQLKDNATLIKHVGGAAEFAAVEKFGRLPAAYVVPLDDPAGPNTHHLAVSQRGRFDFGVVLIVKNARDSEGEHAVDELQDLRNELQQNLLGWTHPDADDITVWGGGNMLGLESGLSMWMERFGADHWVRKV